ncbi:hypothetical protein [uncultured Duncaniella sp.]|uniref:hypothetical protein n=1 Tax=uncultured Duncaniella sp. TaxID=2768039 RepID=UPI0026744475|nr:hypothetical protein [uncultured Duncaniella sp.]
MRIADLIRNRQNDLNWQKTMHCIVKYQPSLYDGNGCYVGDEWTSISDIGNYFNGKELTLGKYLEVENHYVNTILDILNKTGTKYLTIAYLESDNVIDQEITPINAELLSFVKGLEANQRIGINKVPLIIKLCLREYVYAVLVNLKRGLQIEFGYDYYMYVHTQLETAELQEIASNHSLYLNPRR